MESRHFSIGSENSAVTIVRIQIMTYWASKLERVAT